MLKKLFQRVINASRALYYRTFKKWVYRAHLKKAQRVAPQFVQYEDKTWLIRTRKPALGGGGWFLHLYRQGYIAHVNADQTTPSTPTQIADALLVHNVLRSTPAQEQQDDAA